MCVCVCVCVRERERCIRTSVTWCQSLGSYIAPGDHRARVTSSDNIVQWRKLCSYCAKIKTVNGQISWNPSHLLWTQQLKAPRAYHHTTWSLAVNPTSVYSNYRIMNPQTKALRHVACKSKLCWGKSIGASPSQTAKQITSWMQIWNNSYTRIQCKLATRCYYTVLNLLLHTHIPLWLDRPIQSRQTNNMVIQVRNEKGETDRIHRAHIRYLAPRPKHRSHNSLPPYHLTLTNKIMDHHT